MRVLVVEKSGPELPDKDGQIKVHVVANQFIEHTE